MTRAVRHYLAIAGAVIVITAASGCGTYTKLTATWKSPDATAIRFKKILVVAQSSQVSQRRSAESHLASLIPGSTASYDVLTEEETKDVDRARAKIGAAGFDGAVVVRYVGKDTKTTYVPGTPMWGPAPYGSMWGNWGYGWGAAYSPGYLATDTIVTLETHLYSITSDKLIWASQSETTNPTSMNDLMKSLITSTVAAMKKQKVI